jgi:hypothetical protein
MTRALAIMAAVFAVLVVGTTATGSVQALITGANIRDGSIGSNDIRPGAIQSHDIQNGTIAQVDLSKNLLATLQGTKGSEGAKGDKGVRGDKGDKGPQGDQGDSGISGLQADGPYPGRGDPENNLHYGNVLAQSTAMWSPGANLDGTYPRQDSWVMCEPGKFALGGGFGLDDYPSDKLVIVTSVPTEIVNGAPGGTGIPGDPEGSIRPNGWLVQGYNKSDVPLSVRPWVICATVDM